MIKSFSEFNSQISESLNIDLSSRMKWMKSFNQYIVESASEEQTAKVASMKNDDALNKAEKIVEMSTLKILNHYPMFRPFLDIMTPIPRFGAGSVGPDGIGTMSTSGSAIFFDPRFVILAYEQGKSDFSDEIEEKYKKLHFQVLKAGKRHASDYVTFVLIHEILHNSLKHFLRKPVISEHLSEYEVHQLWNIATDYEINHILKPDTMIKIFPGGVDAEDGEFAVDPDDVEFFKTNAAEKIFWRLLKNLEEKRKKQKEEEDDSGDEGDSSDGEGGDSGDEGNSSGGEGDSDGEGGDSGDEGDSDGGDDDDQPLKKGDVVLDNDSGIYGVITSIDGDEVEYDEISREEAESIINSNN